MPLEVGCHAVPHFKALTHNIEHACGHDIAPFLNGTKPV